MATMNDLIGEILAEMPEPAPEEQVIDLDIQVPPPVRLQAEQSVEILNDSKDKFELDGATAVFSTWRDEGEDPINIGDIQISDGIEARAGCMVLDARMTDNRAARLLGQLPEGEYVLRIKFWREQGEGVEVKGIG